jgi:hypothetical protein
MATAGVFQNLTIRLATAPGAGTSRTFTIQKNNVDDALTITISNTATTGSDLTHTVSYAAGDTIRLHMTVSGSPAASEFSSAIEFVPTVDGETIYEFGSDLTGGNPDTGVLSGSTSEAAANYSTRHLVPMAGTLTKLRVNTRGPGPNGGGTFAYSIVLNGVTQDGSGGTVNTTATMTSGVFTANSSFSLSVAAGDVLSVKYVAVGGISGSAWDAGTIVVVPTVAASIVALGDITGPSTSAARYAYPRAAIGILDSWNATESTRLYPAPAVTTVYISAIYAQVSVTPAAGKTWTFTLRINGAGTAAAVTITSAGATASVTGLAVALAPGDTWTLQSSPSGTPAAALARISLLIGLAGTTGGGKTLLLVSP